MKFIDSGTDGVTSVGFLPGRPVLVFGCASRDVIRWDFVTGDTIIGQAHGAMVMSIVTASNSDVVFTEGFHDQICVGSADLTSCLPSVSLANNSHRSTTPQIKPANSSADR